MKTVSLVFEETMAQVSPEDGSHEASAAAANRARSNTWSVGCQPMITAFEAAEDERMVLTALNCSSAEADSSGTSPVPGNKDPATTNFRKNWTRRNAWGNLSYAELITKAIESSPEKRLTLSQIYDWIVHNVDYFANKGDNSSSAGWKNSIRHNLSLHSRFVRLVNDGAGKSSWWSINPDAQPLKPSRRRAATLDSKTLRKRTGLEAGANRKLDFAGRSLEEVDSTTSGPVFSSPSILSPRNSSPDEVTAMDIGEGSPSRYSRERGFVKAGSLSNTVPGDVRIVGETGGRSGSGTPPYGVPRDGFRMDLFGGKGPGQDPELCFPSSENPSVHGTGQMNGGGARVAHAKQRRYAPAPLEDRSISVGGFCAGSGNFYDDVFDPHPVPPGNGYFPKRYYDETGCYTPRLDYGECRSNSFGQDDAYTGGFYGNGGCFSNRTFPGDRYAGESGSVPVQGMGRGPMEVRGGGQANGQGLRAGGFSEVSGVDQNGSRSSDGSTGDENRNLNAFPMARYCASYVDMEGGKGTGGGYDAFQGTYRHDDDCFRDEGVLQRIPSVPRFQDGEHKTESSLTDANFFRALTTMSGYSEEDFPSNPDTLRPISSSPGLPSSQESFYRSSAGGNKYPYLSDPTAKPFSQLLANRATYPTCRNASTVEGFYIPTTF